jgi:hypothetical protein
VVCIAFDVGARLAWFRKGAAGNWNGSASANPAIGAGGVACTLGDGIPLYPAVSFGGTGNVATANFGDTAFTGTVPSGFTSGFTSGTTSPTNAIATQVAVEEWFTTNVPVQVTQVSVEEWFRDVTPIQVTQSALEHWYSADAPIQVTQVAVEHWGSVLSSFLLSDTVATSDAFSVAARDFPEALTDSAATSDSFVRVFAPNFSLSDSVTTADVLSVFGAVSYHTSLSDTASSSDEFDEFETQFVAYNDFVSSDDDFIIIINAIFSLSDTISSFDRFDAILTTGDELACGPIPLFPPLPIGFPIKLSIVMDTTLGTTKSLREMRVMQQLYPLWDIEILFEELLDQTQNQIPYDDLVGYQQYQSLVQTWLMMYGQTGIFAFDAPWDDSRTDQIIGIGDSTQKDFTVFRTWGQASIATAEPVGMIGTVTNVKINGHVVNPNTYGISRNFINFHTPPAANATITMTFGYYYVCRFVEDEQEFEEFSKNRWTVPSLKFRAVYWPGCQ